MYFKQTPKTTVKQWKQRVQFELQGADYNDTLVFKSHEGITLLPFYTSENKQFTFEVQAEARIIIPLYCSNILQTLERINFWLSKNIDCFFVTLHSEKDNWDEFFLQLPEKGMYIINFQYFEEPFFQKVIDLAEKCNRRILIGNDYICNFLKNGRWFQNQYADLKCFTYGTSGKNPIIFTDTTLYQNAGAGMIQQIAYGFSHAMEYLKNIDKTGDFEGVNVYFKVAVGNNFMFEISKLRAFRLVAESVFEALDSGIKVFFIAEPSNRGLSILKSKYNENYIALAYEGAILGGADLVIPKNPLIYRKYTLENELNSVEEIQKVIENRKASFLNEMFSFETISYEIAKKSLSLFQNIEKEGGLLRQIKSHTLQKKIKKQAEDEQIIFEKQIQNLDIDFQEFAKKYEWELYPFVKRKQQKTLVEPLIAKRLWENIEKK